MLGEEIHCICDVFVNVRSVIIQAAELLGTAEAAPHRNVREKNGPEASNWRRNGQPEQLETEWIRKEGVTGDGDGPP